MIRRLFWMVAGALLGVTGYRRVSRLARAVTGGGRRHGRGATEGWAREGWAGKAALFARDVRAGMDLYADRHPRLAGRTLEGQQEPAERLRQGGTGGPGRVHPRAEYAKDGR